MKIGIANDHTALEMKKDIIAYLESKGHEIVDYGTDSTESTDYPIWGEKVANAVASGEVEKEAYNRNVAQTIAAEMADLIVDLEDVSRNYNDYGTLRSYNADDLVFVWNSEWVNKIKKLDVPTIFHKDGLIDKFAENVLPARYFGTINTTADTGNINFKLYITKIPKSGYLVSLKYGEFDYLNESL